MSARDPDCPLCQTDGGTLLWRGPHLRLIEVDDPDYPGFTRVIWNAHLAEMTSLSTHGRDLLMRAVYVVEEAQQSILTPDKINLASLGNMVPHLHWHVIPRWRGDHRRQHQDVAAEGFGTQERLQERDGPGRGRGLQGQDSLLGCCNTA